jgi:hydrogenase maturation protein HypF
MYRLATDLGLTGWVANTPDGAELEIEGSEDAVRRFVLGIEDALPPRAAVHSLEVTYLDPIGYAIFEIRDSRQLGRRIAHVPPDIATCRDCLKELFDPQDRRYRYPFINCTNCGPRFSIITSLPYDRPHTTMASFVMCAECRAEYENPRDRRFHAQPNACPQCGPRVVLSDQAGAVICAEDHAIAAAVEALHAGQIIAVKGLGGFHLLVRADSDRAVCELRTRKRREEKPLALMCPTLEWVRALCEVNELEARALTGPEHPIVLLAKRTEPEWPLSDAVAPGNPNLGVMLPYTPLHHLVLSDLAVPVVATSGNLSDEPICIDEHDAFERLRDIADLFLVHNRPIQRHVDDSIVRVLAGREQVLRRARGYAPLPIPVPQPGPVVLAVGAHLKNTVALALDECVFISQHIGDLDTGPARDAHRRVCADLETLYDATVRAVGRDRHPDYASSIEAVSRSRQDVPVIPVQHHYAHVLSCMADNGLQAPVLGVSWDGTGLGDDGTIWGGEFLRIADDDYQRVAHFRPFPVPGGDAAMREPRRSALGLLYAMMGSAALSAFHTDDDEWDRSSAPVLVRMIERSINAPLTSSVGRLFDAAASLLGIRHVSRFEGQAAMELEWLVRNDASSSPYTLSAATTREKLILDWEPMISSMRADLAEGVPLAGIARGFHDCLAQAIVTVARSVGVERVVLTGGCFQNRYLTETAVRMLDEAGFRAYVHQRVPPNDGGIALGQAVAARLAMRSSEAR